VSDTTARAKAGRSGSSRKAMWIWIAVGVLVVVGMALGTRVVAADDPLAQGAVEFDAATFGAETFPTVQSDIVAQAVEAQELAEAIAADPEAAAAEYAVESSGGPVFSVTFTGVVGEGQSGIYEVDVEGVPDDLLIRVQTGPAINGTELRDATGEITFGQFTNQIDYQNAGSALNEEMKAAVLADIDSEALTGETITVTGAFTLINPESWLVTPVEVSVS
tara:strand:- start:3683 stop:4342 length:660 start_codon:yes stop_codon:yes gene_type:complete